MGSPKYYTGVGSRETPDDVLTLMTWLAGVLSDQGFILRTGNASGADSAFRKGALRERQRVYFPSPGEGDSPTDRAIWKRAWHEAAELHPAWDRCNTFARYLHTRNIFQVLGPRLDEPSQFLVCWTERGGGRGGTGQAIRTAKKYGVPVIDFGKKESLDFIVRSEGKADRILTVSSEERFK